MSEQLKWHTDQRRVDDLIPYEYNPRQLTEEKKQVLIKSLNNFGLVEIPAVDLDNKIIAGHQRVLVLKILGRGEEMIDVRVPNRKLTEKEFKEYNIQSNVSIGYWDIDILRTAFGDIDLMSLGLDINSIELPESLRPIEQKPDEALPVPEVSKKDPLVKERDIFMLNDHVLMCGNSSIAQHVNWLMYETKANIIISDPPYNVDYEGKDGMKIENDNQEDNTFYLFLEEIFRHIYDVCENGAPIYIFYADKESINFRKAFTDAGFKFSQCLIWVKNHFVLGRHDYHFRHEPILYGWKEGSAHHWYGDRDKSSILEFNKPQVSDVHPTMKPVPLLNILLNNSSKPGDLVADFFGGSGSTMISAEQLSRKSRIMELDPRYCEVIIRRYKNYMDQIGKPFQFNHLNGTLTLKEIESNV